MTTSAPSFSGCCNAGLQKQLSTTNSAPDAFDILLIASMSAISISGFDGVSRKNIFVSGRTASFQASRRVGSTKVVVMPNLLKICENMPSVEPNSRCELTIWSPACSADITTDMIALMPEAVAMQASPPSSAASRFWNIVTVGLVKRE